MSHSKERKEKICLNCNTALSGRYCHVCGQENIEPKESVWGIIHHFFSDITHFDGKFFSTSRYLITKPGFLPLEYRKGRRATYLHPIRMYVFSSAVFFFIFYTVFNINQKDFNFKVNGNIPSSILKDSVSNSSKPVVIISGPSYKSIKDYDSVQQTLPSDQRDGSFKRMLQKKGIEINAKHNTSKGEFWKKVLDKLVHTFPYLLFVSLPLYALILKLIYIRRRQFYYVDHGIFLIYLYIFTFILMLLFFTVDGLKEATGWRWLGFLEFIFFLYGVYYAYKSMRIFYAQSSGKTLVKFILLNILAGISLIILFTVFLVFSLFRI
ncbi:MAG: DUF3667 domain-containing protein [Chitinophagaceae bacterium]|nr:DUF3667 domain-containing protein [Chitinophagaceae bacterium]